MQRDANRPVRIIVLKARQLGISTISQAVLFWDRFIYPQSFGLIVAHSTDSTEHLFNMTRMYWDTFPYKSLYTPKYHSKRELAWEQTGSSIRVASAATEGAGRGRTVHSLHASEVAFWEFPEDLMTGLRQTIPQRPGTSIVLESTAQGVGNYFYETWMAARAGDNEYVPLFFPWYEHPEYTMTHMGMPVELERLDSEERLMRRLNIDDDHIAWRRWAIENLCHGDLDMFHQEYPTTDEEAFVTSGANVFPLEKLRECYEPMRGSRGLLVPSAKGDRYEFRPDPLGPLTIYRMPSKDLDWGQYFIAGDPCHAAGYDYACIQIINRRMYEQVAVWHAKIDPVSFADELVKLAHFYNNGEITSEVEGPGYATIGRLMSLNYPHLWRHRWADKVPGKVSQSYGWSTNYKRKDWGIGVLTRLIIDGSLVVHDQRTYEEMRSYTRLPGGSANVMAYGPADESGHDDTVMALMMACICSMTEPALSPYESQQVLNTLEPLPPWAHWAAREVVKP